MQVLHRIADTNSVVNELKNKGKTVGFVPTMGALHAGHVSLVERSKRENDITVVSIFVNPIQFNDKKDLERYPRTLEADCALLAAAGCDYVFAPSVDEMYPANAAASETYSFGQLEAVMEGAHRPGHFNGVAVVVKRLFDIVPAHRAYFGLKDFQQVAIIHSLVSQKNIPIQIIECPIVREPDGLAMSSRNTLLTPEHRKNAVQISQTLFAAQEKAKSVGVDELKAWVCSTINANPFLEVEYFDIVESKSLSSVNSWSAPGNKVGCIAVKAGLIRLIDNISF